MADLQKKISDAYSQVKKHPHSVPNANKKKVNLSQYEYSQKLSKRDTSDGDSRDSSGKAPASSKNDLEVLKQFDLTMEFGPSTGITRMQRWSRAEKHQLNPPRAVRDILDKHAGQKEYKESLWSSYTNL